MFVIITFILGFTSWIMLSGKLDLFHLILGSLSCLFVAVIFSNLLFQEHRKGLMERLAESFRFVSYSGWLLYQIVLANFHVVSLAISPRLMDRYLDPHIFTFTTSLKTDFAKFVLANSITLTPGTVTIRVHKNTFFIHAISIRAAGDLVEDETMSEMEKRVAWVFEGGKR